MDQDKFKKFIEYHKPACDYDVDQLSDLLEEATILDIGSNIGLFTKAIIDKISYKKIYAFEPVKDFFDYSTKTIKDQSEVFFYNFAIGNTNETREISVNLDMNIGSSSLIRNHHNERFETIEIKRLDDLEIKDKIDFIKIDVEGFEADVILGGLKTIEINMPSMFIEIDFPLNNYAKDAFKKLFELGYKPFDLNQKKLKDILLISPKTDRNKKKSNITFVLTSCGRMDLLEQTLDSFFKYNDYPIERYIITEDSADPEIFKQCEELNQRKYGGKLEFIFNYEKLGHLMSVDKAYSMVETDYVFHCQEDWEFLKGDFIEPSIKVLETQPKVIQCWIRPKNDKILNEIEPTIFNLPGNVSIRRVLPCTYTARNREKDNVYDLLVKDYMGFSFNPGVKRISDWKLLKEGYAPILRENLIDKVYRELGYMTVTMCLDDDNGWIKHIGWDRRAGDIMFQKK